MILLLDNYDSFTFNLVQCFAELGAEIEVRRNDAITVTDAIAMRPERLVISPGPGPPAEAGVSLELIRRVRRPLPDSRRVPRPPGDRRGVRRNRRAAPAPRHGKTSAIEHDGRGVFAGMPTGLEVGRYHSLVVEEGSWPAELEIAARSADDGVVMALRHRSLAIHGVQFHPESILTGEGRAMLQNFLRIPA